MPGRGNERKGRHRPDHREKQHGQLVQNWVWEDMGKMQNSLSYEPAHTKDSLKQKRHYFWKQGQRGLLLIAVGQRRRKVPSSAIQMRSQEKGDSWSSQVWEVNMTQVEGETDGLIKN